MTSKKEEGKAHMSHEATNYNFLKQEGNFQMSQKKKKVVIIDAMESEIAFRIWQIV